MVNPRAPVISGIGLVRIPGGGADLTSSITGTVTDPSGAGVPGAVVTATSEATGVTNRQTTTQAGVYSFAALPIGTYTISVEATGFKTAVRSKVVLEVNRCSLATGCTNFRSVRWAFLTT